MSPAGVLESGKGERSSIELLSPYTCDKGYERGDKVSLFWFKQGKHLYFTVLAQESNHKVGKVTYKQQTGDTT